jgi:hypothetical protein
MSAPQCPYCGRSSYFKPTSDIVYGRDYGPIYLCQGFPECKAWVGCHKGTDKPLGRLADAQLRAAKRRAHEFFDPLWKRKMARTGCRQHEARTAAYAWLAEQMGIEVDQCHIGMFDVRDCMKVVNLCRPFAQRKEERHVQQDPTG